MVELKVVGELQSQAVENLALDDVRTGIRSALNKLVGPMDAAKYIWNIPPESVQRASSTTFSFTITLESPKDKVSLQRFGAGVALTRAIGHERAVLRIVD